eukprot:gene1682-451_t
MKKYVKTRTYNGNTKDKYHNNQVITPHNNSEQTIMMKIYITQDFTGVPRNLFHKGNIDRERTFATWLAPDSNTLHCRISTNSTVDDGFNSKIVLKKNQWHKLTFILKDDTYSLYVDDVLDTCHKFVGKVIFNNGPLYIGKDPWYTGFVGKIADFTMYSKAMTQLESNEFDNLEEEKVSSLGNSLGALLVNSSFTDYTIHLKSTEIKCHRTLLIARSKFFLKFKFFLKLFESKMEDSKNDFIELKDFEDKLMKIAINFIYTDVLKTKGCSGSDLIDLMNIGNFLEIDNFSKKISQKIEFILSIENIFEIYLKSFEYDFQEVQNSCVEFIVFHFKEIILLPQYLELPKECITKVFKEYSKQ